MNCKRFSATLIVLVILCMGVVSAFSFDNWKYERGTTFDGKQVEGNILLEKYKPIEIVNAFGLGATLFEGYLSQHDNSCSKNCKSTMEIKLHDDGVLINDIIFKRLREDNSWVEQNINGYYLQYFGTIEDYETVCTYGKKLLNGSIDKTCKDVNVGNHKGWIDYNLGDKVDAGIYTVKINGQKKSSQTIDWVIKTNGEWLESWATWGNISLGDDAEVILNSPADNAVDYDASVIFNCSANITGGSTLMNISLYHNVTGSWLNNQTYNLSGGAFQSQIQYKFNNNLNNDGNDSIGTSTTGTVAYEAGKLNQAYDPQPSNYFEMNDDPITDWGTGDFAVAFWFKNADDSWYVLDEESNQQGIRITSGGSGATQLVLETSVAIVTQGWGGADITDGNWHHVVFTREGTNLSSFIDGNWTNSTTDSTNVSVDAVVVGIISAGSGSEVDALDDFRIYKGAILTPTHVSDLYNSGTGTEDTLVNSNVTFSTRTFTKEINDSTLWTCYACDSDGDCGYATTNRTVFLDTSGPAIIVEAPSGTIDIGVVGQNETLNVTFTDTNLAECWYDYNGTNISIAGCLTGVKNNTQFLIEEADTDMTIYSNDSLSNLNISTISWTYNLTEVSQVYPATSVESATETYSANVNYNSSAFGVITGFLLFNGTQYIGTRTGTGNNATFSADAIMPPVTTPTNITGVWTISLTDVSGTLNYNLTANNVSVEIINLSLCGSPHTVPFWNFTVYNETNLAELNATFEATFSVRQTGSTNTNEFSYADTGGLNSQYDFCMSPSTESYTVSNSIKLTKAGYVDKFYNFQDTIITNSTREDGLYMMTTGDSTSFIVHVVDVSASDVEGAEVLVQRYYQGTGQWLTTEILTTNYVGEAVGHLLSEDADYRFNVSQNGISVYNSSATKITCAVAPCTVTLVIPIVVPTGIEEVEDLTSTLTHSTTTNVFTYTYSDTSGDFSEARLYVLRIFPSNATLVIPCNTTKVTASGVITCDITGQVNGTYRASGYITRTGAEFLDKRIDAILGTDIYNAMGNDGVLWAFFIFIGIVMIGISRPSLAIISGAAGLILVSILGIINIGTLSIVAVSSIAVILLMRIGRE